MKTYKCLNCGKEFKSNKKRTYCCIECYKSYIKNNKIAFKTKRKERIKVVCAECGKVEMVLPCRAKKYVCCSKECLHRYKSKILSEKITKICPICGKEFNVKKSSEHRRKCCSKECLSLYKKESTKGIKNSNSSIRKILEYNLKTTGIRSIQCSLEKIGHVKIAKFVLNVSRIPKGYHVHHKDANHLNNNISNLVVLPSEVHMLIHRIFGNILINALHTNKISKDLFFSMCNEDQKKFYSQIIDLNITHQAVVKQGELLGSHEDDNQQLSIYRNIYESSTTNERPLTCKDEGSNFDTSALPIIYNSEDIV